MTGLGCRDGLLGLFQCVAAHRQQGVLGLRSLYPRLGIVRDRAAQAELFGDRLQIADRRAGQFGERLVGVVELELRQDCGGSRGVIARLCFVDVGDR